jgi:hypothetical protein
MDNFVNQQIQDLLDSGFTPENIDFFQTLDLDYQDLYDNIMNLLDQGYNPEEIIEEIVRQQNEENEAYDSGRTSIETWNEEMDGGRRNRKRKRKTRKGFQAHKSKKRRKTYKSKISRRSRRSRRSRISRRMNR